MDYELSQRRVRRVALHVTCLPPQVNGISSRYHTLLSQISRKEIEIVAIFTSYPNPIEHNLKKQLAVTSNCTDSCQHSNNNNTTTTHTHTHSNNEAGTSKTCNTLNNTSTDARIKEEEKLRKQLEQIYRYAGPSCEWVQLHYTYEDTCAGVRIILHCYHNFETILDTLRRTKPDLMHSTLDATTGNALFAAHLSNIPCVCAAHTDVCQIITKNDTLSAFSKLWRKKTLEYFEWMALHLANNIGTVSSSYAKLLEEKYNINCDFIIRSNVNLKVFENKYELSMPNNDIIKKHRYNNGFNNYNYDDDDDDDEEDEELQIDNSEENIIRRLKKSSKIRAMRDKLMFGNSNDKDARLISYAGRFSHEKNITYLIKVIKEFNKGRKSKIYLGIVGDGHIADELSLEHNKENGIHCIPGFMKHEELSLVYSASDCTISASKFETFGNTVIESHACATPVFVPLTQGFQDTVKHEKNGFFFCYCDNCEKLDSFEHCKECGFLHLRDCLIKYMIGNKAKEELIKIGNYASYDTQENYSVNAAATHMIDWWDRALIEYEGTKECFPEKQIVFAIQLFFEFLFVLQCWFVHLFQWSHKCQHED